MTVLKLLDSYTLIIDDWWGDNDESLRSDLIKNRGFVNHILMEAKLRSIVEPVVKLPQIYDDTVNVVNNAHSDGTTKPIEVNQTTTNKKVKPIHESVGRTSSSKRLPKSIKPVQEPVRQYNSFSIGRTVNSVRHDVDPSMFQEFQVTQSSKPDKV